jgi:hypothetical protein
MTQIATQTTTRSKIVFFIWNNLPRFVLLAMMALIFVLMGSIKEKSGTLKAEKEAAVAEEKSPPPRSPTGSTCPDPSNRGPDSCCSPSWAEP